MALTICKYVSAEVERPGSEKRGAKAISCISYLALLNLGLVEGVFQLPCGRDNIVFIEVAALTVQALDSNLA